MLRGGVAEFFFGGGWFFIWFFINLINLIYACGGVSNGLVRTQFFFLCLST